MKIIQKEKVSFPKKKEKSIGVNKGSYKVC